jgi:hypothetical protein
MKRILLMNALVIALVLTGCKSEPAAISSVADIPSNPPPPASNVGTAPLRSTVLDWNNRNMGEEQFPGWLRVLIVNKQQGPVRQAFGLPDNTVIKVSQAERANREEARVLADLMFAQQIANELKRYIVTGAASRLDRGQMEIVEEITSSTQVTMTGGSKLSDFWQLVEKEDNGIKTRNYIYYSVYSFSGAGWTQLVAKYIQDVIGNISDPALRQQINNSQAEIARQYQRMEERSDAEFQQELALQMKQVDNLQQQEMARINQRVEARHAAYRSGNPVAAAAESITTKDVDWVSALGTVARIVY